MFVVIRCILRETLFCHKVGLAFHFWITTGTKLQEEHNAGVGTVVIRSVVRESLLCHKGGLAFHFWITTGTKLQEEHNAGVVTVVIRCVVRSVLRGIIFYVLAVKQNETPFHYKDEMASCDLLRLF